MCAWNNLNKNAENSGEKLLKYSNLEIEWDGKDVITVKKIQQREMETDWSQTQTTGVFKILLDFGVEILTVSFMIFQQ